jgi:hypothetical protein
LEVDEMDMDGMIVRHSTDYVPIFSGSNRWVLTSSIMEVDSAIDSPNASINQHERPHSLHNRFKYLISQISKGDIELNTADICSIIESLLGRYSAVKPNIFDVELAISNFCI